MKSLFRRVYYWGLSSEEEFQRHQKGIRDVEWDAVRSFIPKESSFLDVGCGTGYSMYRAVVDTNCTCIGVDPFPNNAGVKHQMQGVDDDKYKLLKGVSERIPLDDASFDVVYSSHVLEHVESKTNTLEELDRVLKSDGVLILGVPTATMSLIRLVTILLFETHRNLLGLLLWPFRQSVRNGRRFVDFIIPPSHGRPDQTIFSDLFHYRVRKWKSLLAKHFEIERVLLPALYPFPDYYQLFKMRKPGYISSSVFFICRKKK